MEKYGKIIASIIMCLTLSSCVGEEPNDIAYITALGIDKGDSGYKYTIQFANPTKISGGASEQGGSGGNIVENITVEGPTIYSGLNSADAIVSKDLSLAHAKIIVVSEEIAKEGLGELLEVIARNNDIRPDIYLAIAEEADEYLESVKPVIELNPVKYYQLTYENKKGGPIPHNNAAQFYMAVVSGDRDCVLPLAGVAGIKEKSEGTDAGSGGESKSEGSEENKKATEAQENENNFQKGTKNYFAGDAGVKIKNKSEALGLAIMDGDKYVDKFGSTDAMIYNILMNNIRDMEIVFSADRIPKPVTIRIDEKNIPEWDIDIKKKRAAIDILLEGEVLSIPEGYKITGDECARYIDEVCDEFLQRFYNDMGIDVLGLKGKIKRKFLTNGTYKEYIEKFESKEWKMDTNITLTIKRSGMTYEEELWQ